MTQYAVAIEVSRPDADHPTQIVLYRTQHGARSLSRVATGRRGHSSRWSWGAPVMERSARVTKIVSLPLSAIDAVVVIAKDGVVPTNLLQKAVNALNKVTKLSTDQDATALIAMWSGCVSRGDEAALSSLHVDLRSRPSRSSAGRTPAPATSAPASPVATDAEPPQAMVTPASLRTEEAAEEDVEDVLDEAEKIVEEAGLVLTPVIKYVHRELGGVEDYKILDYALAHHDNVLLVGPTGSGKTTLPICFAHDRGVPVYSVSGNNALEPSQLFGKFIPDSKGGFRWVDGPVTRLVRDGGVLILDEFNLISPKILTVLYPLLDARRELSLLDHEGEIVKAHPDLLVVATGNVGYAGTGTMSQALLDRFHHRWTFGYDESVEQALIKSPTLLTSARSLRNHADLNTPVSTRMLVEFERFFLDFGWEYAFENTIINRFWDEDEKVAARTVFKANQPLIESELRPQPEPDPVEESTTGVPNSQTYGFRPAPWETDETL